MDWKTAVASGMDWAPPVERVFPVPEEELIPGDWGQWDLWAAAAYVDVAAHNAEVIQRCLDQAGESGGGRVLLPAGVYCLKGDTTQFCSYCLTIRYDNVTLEGKGRDAETGEYKTVLKTAHQWDGPNGVYRCSAILIYGTEVGDPSPRKNIAIMGLELEGGRGWTGTYDWGYDPAVDYGWDIGHKGITVAHDKQVTHVLLRDLYVHRYSGETVFVGGPYVGYLQVEDCVLADTNASCFNLYAKYLLVRRSQFGTPDTKCRFWIEYCARASTIAYKMPPIPDGLTADCASFIGNCFYNSVGAHGVAIAQGDNTRFAYVFADNQFDNSACEKPYALFQFAGSVAGPATIVDNEVRNTRGPMLMFDNGGGTQPPNTLLNQNILFARNRCENVGSPMIHLLGTWGIWDYELEKSFPMQQPIEHITVEDNDFTGLDPEGFSVAVGSYYHDLSSAVCLKDIVIRNNRFCRCRPPVERDEFIGRLPLFAGNVYSDSQEAPAVLSGENNLLCPVYESFLVRAEAPVTARLRTAKNQDGQRVVVTGAADTEPVRFVPGGEGYWISEERELRAGETITFQYRESDECWVCED